MTDLVPPSPTTDQVPSPPPTGQLYMIHLSDLQINPAADWQISLYASTHDKKFIDESPIYFLSGQIWPVFFLASRDLPARQEDTIICSWTHCEVCTPNPVAIEGMGRREPFMHMWRDLLIDPNPILGTRYIFCPERADVGIDSMDVHERVERQKRTVMNFHNENERYFEVVVRGCVHERCRVCRGTHLTPEVPAVQWSKELEAERKRAGGNEITRGFTVSQFGSKRPTVAGGTTAAGTTTAGTSTTAPSTITRGYTSSPFGAKRPTVTDTPTTDTPATGTITTSTFTTNISNAVTTPPVPQGAPLRMCHTIHLKFQPQWLTDGTLNPLHGIISFTKERRNLRTIDKYFVPEDLPVFAFGGPVHRVEFPNGDGERDVMACTRSVCKYCHRRPREGMSSPSRGMPWVHRRCFRGIVWRPGTQTGYVLLPEGARLERNYVVVKGDGDGVGRRVECWTCREGSCGECDGVEGEDDGEEEEVAVVEGGDVEMAEDEGGVERGEHGENEVQPEDDGPVNDQPIDNVNATNAGGATIGLYDGEPLPRYNPFYGPDDGPSVSLNDPARSDLEGSTTSGRKRKADEADLEENQTRARQKGGKKRSG